MDFKCAITQINFYIVNAYKNCDKVKKKRERKVGGGRERDEKRDGFWLDARSLLALDVFALVASKSDAYIIPMRLSSRFVELSVDEIYYAFNRHIFNDSVSP